MRQNHRRTLAGLIVASTLAFGPAVFAAIGTQDLTTQTATDLANALVGAGVVISNVTYTGSVNAGGTFTGGTGVIGFDQGVILSSGSIANVIGPNTVNNKTTNLGLPGDADLTTLAGVATFDATVLEFDFVPNADKVFFQYVFASEEYNEFVNSPFNDTFGFFVNGANCATVGGLPVSINTINNGNPFGTLPNSHPELYINNDIASGAALNTEMDGLTIVLTCESAVLPNVTNHIKLAIADGSDQILDSNVFLRAGSFSTTPPTNACPLSQGYWKNHASAWPVQTLTLGGQSYTQAELLALLLGQPVKGDASLILAKQLIAAKLNIANGADPNPVKAAIIAADALLNAYAGKLPYNVKVSTVAGSSMTATAATLDSYNNGVLTPNCGIAI